MRSRTAFTGNIYGIVLVMLVGLSLIAATDKKPAEFDFKKTSAYTHELETRPDFPVSAILARNYVYSVLALDGKIDGKMKQKTIDYLKNLQRRDGGFSVDSIIMETSSQNTDFALETLSLLNALGTVDAGEVKTYLSSLQRSDGGFALDSKTKESSLVTTYYAVHVLSFVNGLNTLDKARVAAYIRGFEKKDTGGFSYVKGSGVSSPKNTYMAIFTLKTLGMLDDQTKKNAVRFLVSTPYGGKPAKYDVTQTLEEQAYTIMTLKMAGAENRINKKEAVKFIKGFYIPENGGFGPMRGYGTAPDPTYFGVRGLAELGVLKSPR